MKLATLHLQTWRCHLDRTIPLAAGVTLITGDNGTGKTSVQDALEQLVSGRCQHTDENGAGARLVRDGARTCAITATLPQDGTRITRSYPPNELSLSWKPGVNVTEAQAALNETMGCTGDMARLSLRTGRFFGLQAKDRNGKLTALMALEPEPERMAAELAGLRGKGLAIDAALKAAEVKPTASLERIQKATYARRTSCKSEQAKAKAEAERLEAAFQQLDDEPNPPSLKELADSKAAVQNATLALGRAQAEAKQVEVLKTHLDALELQENLAANSDHVAKLPAMLEREGRIRPRLAELREQVRKLEGRLPELSAARRRLAVVEAALAENGACPTCGGPVRDRGKLETEAAELGAAIDTLAAVPAQLQEVRAKLASGEKALADLLPQIAEAQRLTGQAGRIEEVRAELERLRAQAGNPAELEAALAAARVAEAEVLDRQQARTAYQAAEAAAKAAAAKLATLTAEREALEALVAWSGPKGLRARLLAERIGPFEEALRGILYLFGLDGRHAETKEGLTLEVATGGAWVPWDELSDSEQLRVGFAYQVAFGVYTGLRIVVLDRIEALDAAGQAALFAAAAVAVDAGWADHILLIGVDVRCPVPLGVSHVQLEREVAHVA